MELALYSKSTGYYAHNFPGPQADYTTAPAISPVFGTLLAAKLDELWKSIGSPSSFHLTEVGAGGGDLASAVWKSADQMLRDALRFRFVERHLEIEEHQRRRIQVEGIPSTWVRSLKDLQPESGCVLANELLDNFPFDVFQTSDDGLSQLFVTSAGESLSEQWGQAEEPEAWELASGLEPETRFELHRGVPEFIKDSYAAIDAGYLLILDYGDSGSHLRHRFPEGTAVTYRREVLGTDLLASPGECDITAHVDFTRVRDACVSAGFDPMPVQTQREFLLESGILLKLDSLKEEADRAGAQGDHSLFLQKTAARSKAATLIYGPMGDYRVLLAR